MTACRRLGLALRKLAVVFRLTARGMPLKVPSPPRTAFRSTFDDACYDVRGPYGVNFAEWVAGVSAGIIRASPNDDGSSILDNVSGGYV
jgi:hypothetical protein